MTTKPQSTNETLEPIWCTNCGNQIYQSGGKWYHLSTAGMSCNVTAKAMPPAAPVVDTNLVRLIVNAVSLTVETVEGGCSLNVKRADELVREVLLAHCTAAATAAPQQSLLREPVRVDVSPQPLVVTRDGVPCPDQKAALEEFKEACRSVAIAAQEQPLTPQQAAMLEQNDDMARDRTAVPPRQSGVVDSLHNTNILCRSGEGRPKVEIWFKDLKAAQKIHKWLVSLAANTNEEAR